MAESNTLARPYARAAFEYANETGRLDHWSILLELLSLLAQQPVVKALFKSPGETPSEKAKKLSDLCGDQMFDAGRNFIFLLAEYRRLSLLPEINTQFGAFKAEQEKSMLVEVVAARPLTDLQQASLIAALKGRLQREIYITVTVDPLLLGGAVIRAGDTVIDGSVRGRLGKLTEAINS